MAHFTSWSQAEDRDRLDQGFADDVLVVVVVVVVNHLGGRLDEERVGLEHLAASVHVQRVAVDWKRRAIEQWTADPCGPEASGAEDLLRGRPEYAPWIPAALDYHCSAGLDVLDVGAAKGST